MASAHFLHGDRVLVIKFRKEESEGAVGELAMEVGLAGEGSRARQLALPPAAQFPHLSGGGVWRRPDTRA